ncbi:MAG TPA: ABC transporter substrate-binding protein [Longimicrobiales bacterium]|nr:ABC transporter substrate-binding protein [Longimicrobiales bacterium]
MAAGACTSEPSLTVLRSSDSFCAEVLPAVDAFLEQARGQNPVQDAAQFGGTVVVGALGEITSGMNSTATADYVAGQHQQFVNLMPLLEYDAELNPRPYLAESWTVSEDGTELTFRIRDDVVWHDGERTDAHDVAFTYLRVTDPAAEFPNAAFWDHYVTGPEGVEVLDDFTVRIRLLPHADFLDPWRSVAILPEHLLGDVPPAELRGHPYGTQCPVGNGPFVFLEHREQEMWRFAANPAFPAALGGRPYLDEYVYRVIPDENTLLLELLSGGVDVFISPQPDQAPAILEDPDLTLLSYPFRNVTFVAWNARRPQLADPRVRQALTLATHRQEIVQALLLGYGSVANGTVPPWHWAFDGRADEASYDPERARALLDQAGWQDRDGDGVRENAQGLPLSVSLKSNQGNRRLQRLSTIMQAQLREVGVELRVEVMEWSALVAQLTDTQLRDYDGVVLSWVTEFKLDDTDLFHSERVDRPYAFSGTLDAQLDAYLDSLALITDRGRARAMWGAYQERLAQVHPYTFFYFPDRLDGVNRRVQGVVMDARGEWVNLREWWIAPQDR